jgi:hypothetical protein
LTPFARCRLALVTVPLLILGLCVGALAAQGRRQTSPPTPAIPAIDPRLILRPQHVLVRGTLAGGAAIAGSIYPGIPYRANTIQIAVTRGGHVLAATGDASVSVTMAGMRMLPVTAALHSAGSDYAGTLFLPMFGSYLGSIAIATANGSLTGTIEITAPLPGIYP